ncbi:hypothetical protein ACS5PN_22580 [Roseateles sp. NT4]
MTAPTATPPSPDALQPASAAMTHITVPVADEEDGEGIERDAARTAL